MLQKLYSYVLKYDTGAAPNPFWGTCTLTICKPDIRRTANENDWVIGTGSKNTRLKDGNIYDFSGCIVYAMKVSEKLSLAFYDKRCIKELRNKIPKWFDKNYKFRIGDCIYNYKNSNSPKLRVSVHNTLNMNDRTKLELFERDLRGENALLSDCFFYFGEEPRQLPYELQHIIKKGQKHKVIKDDKTIKKFEEWISQFTRNKIYAQPQLKYKFDNLFPEEYISKCAEQYLKD